jgi:hypothetical protein
MPSLATFPASVWDGTSKSRQPDTDEPIDKLVKEPDGYDWLRIVAEVAAVQQTVKDGGGGGGGGGAATQWRVGSGTPSDETGIEGDLFLDSQTGDVHQKVDGHYVIVANIQGAPVAISTTSTRSSIAATTTTGTTLLAGNSNRKGFMLYNNSQTLTWYISYGSGGSPSNFSILLAPGDVYENTISTQILTGCASAASGGSLQVTEFTA